MLVIMGRVTILPEDRQRFEDAARDVTASSREEPGCTHYGFWRDLDTEHDYLIFEEWDDQAAMDHHVTTAPYLRFREVLQSLQSTVVHVWRYTGAACEQLR